MKLKVFLALFFAFFYAQAQDSPPNIKVTDIFGNFYMSSDILADGQFLFVDFFTNGCSSCQYEAPKIDTVFRLTGCNCNNIFFLGINKNATSTNESVFEFTQTYGMSFPAVSGEGGGAAVAQNYGVTYTPYWLLISPDNELLIDTFFWIGNSKQLIDTLTAYGAMDTALCKGTDINFFRIISGMDTLYANIDKNSSSVIFNVPLGADLTNLVAFMVISPNANAYLDGNLQNTDSSVIDLTDTLTYTIIAEDSSYTQDWNVYVEYYDGIENDNSSKSYFNTSNNILYFDDYKAITYYSIFDLSGRLLFKVKPTRNDQNLNILPSGIYLIQINKNDGITENLKIIKH